MGDGIAEINIATGKVYKVVFSRWPRKTFMQQVPG